MQLISRYIAEAHRHPVKTVSRRLPAPPEISSRLLRLSLLVYADAETLLAHAEGAPV